MSTGQLATKEQSIMGSLDKKVVGGLSISAAQGGMQFENMAEVMDFAKLMSVSHQAVPPHCRNQPGVCLGITVQAVEWLMSPFAVANKSYIVNDRLGYESQLIHAVVEQRAPIVGRLRHEFIGTGDKRQCRVWATAKGEAEPLSYTSPEFATIQPRNSPLWKTKPDLQLYYNTSRDWARVYFPDVILGVYSEDELLDAKATVNAQGPPTNLEELAARLPAPASRATVVDKDGTPVPIGEGVDEPSQGDGIDEPSQETGADPPHEDPPSQDAEAIAEIERLRAEQAAATASGTPDNPAAETPEERADREAYERSTGHRDRSGADQQSGKLFDDRPEYR